MMAKWFLVMVITSLLWTTCLSDYECSSTIFNTTQIIFTCLSNVTINELPLYNYTSDQLANITSIVVNGINDTTPGPFTSIPPNICLLSNLESIDFSYNHISQLDPEGVLSKCLLNVSTLDVSYNNISEFPSAMVYNMPTLQNLYFRHNQLTDVPGNAFFNLSNLEIIDFSHNLLTTFELWALLVKTSADFTNNQISTITNALFLNISQYTLSDARIDLTNNSATINLTDAVYEMYSSCSEVYEWLYLSLPDDELSKPILTAALTYIYFGTTQINCNCDQSYLVQMILNSLGSQLPDVLLTIPIYNATCIGNTRFLDSSCNSGFDPPNSSVDFSKVYPRQCKILQNETGSLTNIQNISVPTLNVSTYPHYETGLMNPGACFFTFSDTVTVRIKCTNDISNSSIIPSALLSSTYFSNITHVNFTPPISSLPSYLCSLPSHEIDLSFQSFTTLSDTTFPCLDSFNKVTLAYNQLTSVNMTSGNFSHLTILDLSSNRLTEIPYSILIPTPSSLSFLDLRNNSITSIDLFLYTLKNITVDLRDNPINSSSIINPQNITLPTGNNTDSTVIITLPPSVTNSTYIFNDQTALTAGTCNSNTVLAYQDILRSIYTNVVLDCTCASINLKEIFLRSGLNITDSFDCLNGTTEANFYTLTMSSCISTALNFSMGLCYNESLQTSTDNTTMGALSTTVQITSTSLTLLINSSLSSNVTQNQQYTSLPGFEETGLNLYTTLPTTNISNQLSTIYVETITSKNSSYSDFTSASATNNSDQMATSSSMNTIVTLLDTSSLSSTSLITDTTTPIIDNNMTTSTGWTTTTTTTTTSTSTSTSSSTSTTTTSQTTSTTSTSTNASDEIIQSSGEAKDSSSSQTGLIVGLVLGLVAFFALVGALIAVIVIKKSKSARSGASNRSIGRASAISQAPQDALLESRLQTRNLRSVRLAPLGNRPSLLPPSSYGSVAPVMITTDPSTGTLNKSNLRTSSRGIPVRLDPVRSPSNVVPQYVTRPSTSNDSFNFHPTNNPPTIQHFSSQPQSQKPRPRQPRSGPVLNVGGDTRY